eukprot:COSAG06_NODE_19776_length_822_cov_18.302905_1_plen_75_part_10
MPSQKGAVRSAAARALSASQKKTACTQARPVANQPPERRRPAQLASMPYVPPHLRNKGGGAAPSGGGRSLSDLAG